MKKAIVLSILLLVIGCAHTEVWYSPSKTVEETRRDVEECKKMAAQSQEPPRISRRPGYPTDQGAKMRDKVRRIEDCLKEKGYGLVEKSYLDSRDKEYYDAPPF